MAPRGLLHVPCDEPRSARPRGALCGDLEPELRGPSGPWRAHASAVPRDGCCGGCDWASDRCAGDDVSIAQNSEQGKAASKRLFSCDFEIAGKRLLSYKTPVPHARATQPSHCNRRRDTAPDPTQAPTLCLMVERDADEQETRNNKGRLTRLDTRADADKVCDERGGQHTLRDRNGVTTAAR